MRIMDQLKESLGASVFFCVALAQTGAEAAASARGSNGKEASDGFFPFFTLRLTLCPMNEFKVLFFPFRSDALSFPVQFFVGCFYCASLSHSSASAC